MSYGIPTAFVGAEPCEGAPTEPRNTYIWGGNGRGKTHTACGLLRRWAEQRGGGLYVGASTMLHRVVDGMRTSGMDALCREYERVPVLVLDDICAHRMTDMAVEVLSRIIDTRHNADVVTIVTGNLPIGLAPDEAGSPATVNTVAGTRIARRLHEYRNLPLTGEYQTRRRDGEPPEPAMTASGDAIDPQTRKLIRWWWGLPHADRAMLLDALSDMPHPMGPSRDALLGPPPDQNNSTARAQYFGYMQGERLVLGVHSAALWAVWEHCHSNGWLEADGRTPRAAGA